MNLENHNFPAATVFFLYILFSFFYFVFNFIFLLEKIDLEFVFKSFDLICLIYIFLILNILFNESFDLKKLFEI